MVTHQIEYSINVFSAYIAASRRSDRSLEARVESARRASEIHKRRTGRSLRVTEQDVVNEEMYEEEDDDLPLPYRRLTSHLQTNSVDFNRRLAAYLTNQVAMRSAMEQMVSQSFAQQFPNAPQFGQNQQFPSPMVNTNMGSPSMPRPSPTTASSYRSAPYPSPHSPAFQQPHGRAYSMAAPNVPNGQSGTPARSPVPPTNALHQRRMSMPAASISATTTPSLATEGISPADPEQQRQTQSASISGKTQDYFPPFWQDTGPFTTTLPPETQQMIGPALDPNDPFSSVLMSGSDSFASNPYYPWGNMLPQNMKAEQSSVHPSFDGMSATLAPSALDMSGESFSAPGNASNPPAGDQVSAPSSGLDFNLSQDSTSLKGMPATAGTGLSRQNSSHGLKSGHMTPAEGFSQWDSYIQDGTWGDEGVAS